MRTFPTLAGLALATAGLAGCTGAASGASGVQDPIATATPDVSVSVTPTPTALPGEHTVAGAVEFVRAYLAESNHAYATGDVALLQASSSEVCAACRTIISSITETHASGGTFVAGQVTSLSADSLSTTVVSPMSVAAIVRTAAGSVISAGGDVRKTAVDPGSTLLFTLNWTHDHWITSGLRRLAKA